MVDVKDISHEVWRDYCWKCPVTGKMHNATFENPTGLVVGKTTHRIIYKDADNARVASIVPAPGYMGCVVSWRNPDDMDPVQF